MWYHCRTSIFTFVTFVIILPYLLLLNKIPKYFFSHKFENSHTKAMITIHLSWLKAVYWHDPPVFAHPLFSTTCISPSAPSDLTLLNPPKILPPDWLPLFMKTNTTQCSTFTLAVSMVRKYYFKCGLAAYHSHHPSSCKLPFWPFSSVSGPTLQSLPVYFQEQQLRLNSEGCLFSLRLIPSRLKTFCTAKGSLSPSLSFFALTLQGP